MHTQNNECTSDCRREGCPETDGISLSPEKLSEIDTKWTEKCTCENFQQNEDCEHIGDKVLEEVGLGVGDKDCPDCKVDVGCSKHYIEDGDRHDRIKGFAEIDAKWREEFVKKEIYCCRGCGISMTNRKDWCDLGCGRDYNEMFKVVNFSSLLQQKHEESYKLGRQSVLDEIEEDQKKFLAGFSYKKPRNYCDLCRTNDCKHLEKWCEHNKNIGGVHTPCSICALKP